MVKKIKIYLKLAIELLIIAFFVARNFVWPVLNIKSRILWRKNKTTLTSIPSRIISDLKNSGIAFTSLEELFGSADVLKTLVYALARYRNSLGEVIPESTLTKAPSAELRPNQKDEDSLPPYAVLDPVLEAYLEENLGVAAIAERTGADVGIVREVVRKVRDAEYKRLQMARGPKVTSKAFGPGRRWPIAARYIV